MLIICKAPADSASGKQGREAVYYRINGQQCARNYVVPRDPRAALQSLNRSQFTLLSRQWQTLSDADRASWADYADTHQITNRLGNLVTPTPMNAFMSLNRVKSLNPDTPGLLSTAPTATTPDAGTLVFAPNTDLRPGYLANFANAYTSSTTHWVLSRSFALASAVCGARFAQFLYSGTQPESNFRVCTDNNGSHFYNVYTRFNIYEGIPIAECCQIVDEYGQTSAPAIVTGQLHLI